MLAIRTILPALLIASLVSLNDEEAKIGRDCAFNTCRDCATVRCTWGIFFNGDQKCIPSSRGVPGIEAEVKDPKECPKPKCVAPNTDHWDAIGLAQLLGGLFGGLLAGLCGGAAINNWRRGRVLGYERLEGGQRSWREVITAFFGTFLERLARRDDEAPLVNNAEEERLREAAVNRLARQQAERERLERQRNRDAAARNQAREGEGRQEVAQEDGGAQVAQPVGMPQRGLGMQFGDVEVAGVGADVPANRAGAMGEVQGEVVLAGSESSGSMGDSDDGENHNQPGPVAGGSAAGAPAAGGPSPLVQQVQVARKSLRAAAVQAKARIAAQKPGKKN